MLSDENCYVLLTPLACAAIWRFAGSGLVFRLRYATDYLGLGMLNEASDELEALWGRFWSDWATLIDRHL
jgi:hypothetical protein